MRAWSYVRVSTDEQITGDGLNRQNRLYLDACALYGWEPAEHQVVDALSGFSGANAQRGGLAKILRAIDNGTIPAGDVLVLEDIDRLSRLPPMESAGILNQIIGAGVQVYIVSMKLLVNKQSVEGFDCLYIVLKMVLAHDESKKKSERVKQSVKARKDAGVKWTGKRPIWLTTNFEVNEIGSTIKLMFKLSALGPIFPIHGDINCVVKKQQQIIPPSPFLPCPLFQLSHSAGFLNFNSPEICGSIVLLRSVRACENLTRKLLSFIHLYQSIPCSEGATFDLSIN